MAKKEHSPSSIEKKFQDLLITLTRIPFIQKIFFLDHLRIMIHASLSLVEALAILQKEVPNKKFRKIITEISSEIEQGHQLSESLSKYPKVFPTMYVKMVESGEIAGKLDESLEQIVIQMKKSQELSSSIRGAMIYPSVILAAMGGIGVFMMIFVLPKLIEIFKEFNAELPLATRALISLTNFISNPVYLTLVIATIIGIIVSFSMLLKRVTPFRRAVHAFNLRLPIAGPIIKQINLARFSLTLSSLLKSTIPIIDAVDITAETCSNMLYQQALHRTASQIKSGQPLSEVLASYEKLFPPMVTEMIMVGERTGEVDRLLNELAGFYSNEVDKTMKNFTVIIEPVIILLLGISVAGVAVAVIMPIYSLTQNF